MEADILGAVNAAADPQMVIVTVAADGRGDGCLVGFSTQCSIDPARFLVCLSKDNRSYDIAERAGALGVHVLHDDDRPLAELFGAQTGFDVDKLARCRWSAGPLGLPILDGCDWFAGPVVGRFDFGDHVGFSIDVTHSSLRRIDEPRLSYAAVADLEPGNPRSSGASP